MKARLSLIACIIFSIHILKAQNGSRQDETVRAAAIQQSLSIYQQMAGDAAPVFAGRQYEEYDSKLQEGHPFAVGRKFMKGYVVFDGIIYENLRLKFDLLLDKLLIPAPSGSFLVMPDIDKVSEFSLDNHVFVKIDRDPKNVLLFGTRFYEVLVDATEKGAMLLKKETKSVADETTVQGLRRYIVQSDYYFIKRGNNYYAFTKKSNVLDALSDHKAEIRQYIRQQNLDIADNKEESLVKIITYYNSLNK